VDGLGIRSDWAPATPSTVRIDREAPSAPAVAGGSSAWQRLASVTVRANGATDARTSVRYQSRTSSDGGASWSAPADGPATAVTAEGETIVQFRAVDEAGNASSWAPAAPTPASTVMLDRTTPTDPAVSGGSLAWQDVDAIDLAAAGSQDALSGLAGYERRTSTDGGQTWSDPVQGAGLAVSAEGQTLVQFRALDTAGNASPWYPDAPRPASTARIDRTAPARPTVTGGALAWTGAEMVAVLAGGATDALSGVAPDAYEHETSSDGGATWSSPAPGSLVPVTAEGQTLVRFRAVDGAGLRSDWAPETPTPGSTVRIDRVAPTPPTVAGGSGEWQPAGSVLLSASGSADERTGGALTYESRTSADGGQTWTQPVAGATRAVTREGETIVQFRALDGARNPSPWAPAVPAPESTVRLDRSAPTVPAVSGGSAAWQSVDSVTVGASGSADPLSGFDHYEARTSSDRGVTWSDPVRADSVTMSGEGETLVQFRAVDALGAASEWAPASSTAASTIRIDRSAPGVPTVSGGSNAWQDTDSVAVSAGGSTDALSGVAQVSYEYRTSPDGTDWSEPRAGGAALVAGEGTTYVQFRALDAAGNASPGWVPAQPVPASTVRIDRTPPSSPTLAGGSGAWQNVASLTVTASGSDDAASGFSGYQHRVSTDGGRTWSEPDAGDSLTVSEEGQTLVQFRALDVSGLASAWTPSSQTGAATVRIDRTAPSVPSIVGGSSAWRNVASTTVTASGATDALAGAIRYRWRTSSDGGRTWDAPRDGPSAVVSREGETLVQFQATDGAANSTDWLPAQPTPGSTVRIDRSAPTAPAASGGSLTWSARPETTITATSSDAASGVASYEHRLSVDGGKTWSAPAPGATVTVSAQGETLVQFRASDVSGFVSAWAPAPRTAGATVRLDRTAPSAPTVAGGSSSWRNRAAVTVTASGSSDAGGSTLAGYRWRTSRDGAHWSASQAGPATIVAEGVTYVQFQATDVAGNASAWMPAPKTATATVKLDRSAPSLPSVTGGSLTCAAKRTIAAAGAIDPGVGGVRYEARVSTDAGATWAAAQRVASVTLTTPGHYVVQFRALDALRNASAWEPATAGPANSACIR
jgi:hypothetical protein